MNTPQDKQYDQPPPLKKRRIFPLAFDAPSKLTARSPAGVGPSRLVNAQSGSFPKAFDEPLSKSRASRDRRISEGETISTSKPESARERGTALPPPRMLDKPGASSKSFGVRDARLSPLKSAFLPASTSTPVAARRIVGKNGSGNTFSTPLPRAFDEPASSRPASSRVSLDSTLLLPHTPLRALKPPSFRSLDPPPHMPDKGSPFTPLRAPDSPSFADAEASNADTPLRTLKPPIFTNSESYSSETPLRVLKPPHFSTVQTDTPLRPLKPPAFKPRPTNTTPLRPLKPPSIFRAERPVVDTAPISARRPRLPPAKEPIPLQPLKPPLLSPRHTDHSSSSIHATDDSPSKPTTTTAKAESASTHPSSSPLHPELMRGLDLSPQKNPRGRGPKYIRGGLAERAAHLLSRAETGRTLWRTELSQRIAAAGGEPPRADMKLHVITARHIPGSGRGKEERRVLATCRAQDDDDAGEGTVVFVSARDGGKDMEVRAGTDVLVWRPWGEVDVPEGGEREGRRMAMLCARFLVVAGESGEREGHG